MTQDRERDTSIVVVTGDTCSTILYHRMALNLPRCTFKVKSADKFRSSPRSRACPPPLPAVWSSHFASLRIRAWHHILHLCQNRGLPSFRQPSLCCFFFQIWLLARALEHKIQEKKWKWNVSAGSHTRTQHCHLLYIITGSLHWTEC